jgi:DNA-binding LytR/AlgR family response regulator
MKIKTIIVDDEPLAREVLENYSSRVNELQLLASCNNALEAGEFLRNHSVDLMFLDIQMPQLSGIEFLKSLPDAPVVIFTTAYSDYALDGFELDVADYLLKPISFERFLRAVHKASEKINARKAESESTTGEIGDTFFFVKADKKLIKINFEDILYIEGLKDYVIIRMESGRVITLQTMKSLEERLPQDIFRRIHRSYIINIRKINALLGNTIEIMEAGKVKQLPIGKNYRDDVYSIINTNKW